MLLLLSLLPILIASCVLCSGRLAHSFEIGLAQAYSSRLNQGKRNLDSSRLYEQWQSLDDGVGGKKNAYSFWEDAISCKSFNSDLQNLVDEDVQKAQDALDIMEEFHRLDPTNKWYIMPNAECYSTVLQGWIQSTDPDAADKAQALRSRMEDQQRNSQ